MKSHRLVQVARVVRVELLILAAGLSFSTVAVARAPLWATMVSGALCVSSIGLGLFTLLRTGELELAWWCPRLSALGLRPETSDLPWATLRAAELALTTFDREGRQFREFFPEARLELLRSACRVLDAHRLKVRAERALVDAPEGDARGRLQAQRQRADDELMRLTASLRSLRARLIASTAPVSSVEDPVPALERIDEQSRALEQAMQVTSGLGRVIGGQS